MKNKSLLSGIVFFLFISLLSCKKDNHQDEIPIPEEPSWSEVTSLSGGTFIEICSEGNKIYAVGADVVQAVTAPMWNEHLAQDVKTVYSTPSSWTLFRDPCAFSGVSVFTEPHSITKPCFTWQFSDFQPTKAFCCQKALEPKPGQSFSVLADMLFVSTTNSTTPLS